MKTTTRSLRRIRLATFAILTAALAATTNAQQQVGVDIFGSQAAAAVRITVPFPTTKGILSAEVIRTPLFTPLMRDLAFSEVFAIIPVPADAAPTVASAKTAGAQAFLAIEVGREGDEFLVEARLSETATGSVQLARRYRGPQASLTRIAHTLANDLVRFYNGRSGPFLTQIAYSSNASGHKEIWLMDYDGSNRRKLTSHNTIAITPDWSPDGEKIVYTGFSRISSDMYLINRRGGGLIKISTGLGLNTSPKYSPDGKEIVFVGSLNGNPDIYIIGADGKGLRHLTTENSIESSPAWSPTGRQIAFTSGRAGSPQIYVMDAEGTNVRRISFEGNWNDDPAFSPSGELLAYTSRVEGRFQIRIMNLATGESSVLAGEGSNEQPEWSPDGKSIVFASNRSGRWRIYRIALDGRNLTPLTDVGDDISPRWSAILE